MKTQNEIFAELNANFAAEIKERKLTATGVSNATACLQDLLKILSEAKRPSDCSTIEESEIVNTIMEQKMVLSIAEKLDSEYYC